MSGGMIVSDTSGLADIVMTTDGDLVDFVAPAGRTRLPIGAVNSVLTSVGGFPTWQLPAAAGGDGGIATTCDFAESFHMYFSFTQKDITNTSFTDTWGMTTYGGTASYAFVTGKDWGIKLTTGTGLYDGSFIGFIANTTATSVASQLHQPFDSTGAVLIWGQQWNSATDGTQASSSGLMEGTRGDAAGVNAAIFNFALWSANFQARTCGAAGAQTNVDTGIATNNNVNIFKIETSATDCKYYINGALTATITTNLPTGQLGAVFGAQNHTNAGSGASVTTISFVEGYNT